MSQVHCHRSRANLFDVRFVKISGATGDWIVFYDPPEPFGLTSDQIIWLCDRGSGVGASGVVLLTQHSQNPQSSTLHLQAWKHDGRPTTYLSEAARAAAFALAALKVTPASETTHQVFATARGIVTTVYTPSFVGVDIGQWSYTAPETATAAGSDTLVMAAGLTDPRPGLSIRTQGQHITVAVETSQELAEIDLTQPPSIEPAVTEPTGLGFVVPQDPLLLEGMGQLAMRDYPPEGETRDIASAAAAATVAFQAWSGLTQLKLWNVRTSDGDIVVQLHEDQRVSTFVPLSAVFFGRL